MARFILYADGEECKHRGCRNHISHPCEGCGRKGARGIVEKNPFSDLRQITLEEWKKYRWLDVGSYGSEYIRGIEFTEPPPKPNDGFAYVLVETTTMGDSKQSWEWRPCMTTQ